MPRIGGMLEATGGQAMVSAGIDIPFGIGIILGFNNYLCKIFFLTRR